MFSAWTQDNYLRYVWKPAGVASSFGKEKCFLEYLAETDIYPFQDIFLYQKEFFSAEQEYGLLNRLDNHTSGFLYFAKTPLFHQYYKSRQGDQLLQKKYIADVSGRRDPEKIAKNSDISLQKNSITIHRSIAHHRHLAEKMVVLPDAQSPQKYLSKIQGKQHAVETKIELLYFDEQTNRSTLAVTISKGIRHQIRAHLASVGYPIVGDQLYGGENEKILHLWSVGLEKE